MLTTFAMHNPYPWISLIEILNVMQTRQYLSEMPINTPIITDKDPAKDLLPKKVKPSNPKTVGGSEIIAPPAKGQRYPEPVIPRSIQKDRIEIW